MPGLTASPTLGVTLSESATPQPLTHVPLSPAYLLVSTDGGNTYRFTHPAKVGRAVDCDVVVPDERISSVHCCLAREPITGAVFIQDCSSNGTYVNGRRVGGRRTVRLSSGDQIEVVMVKKPRSSSPAQFVVTFIFHDLSDAGLQGSAFRAMGPSPVRSWQLGSEIGRGAHGSVAVGINNETGELIAIKIVPKSSSPGNTPVTSAANERGLLSTLEHPRIVQYLGFHETDEAYMMFLEYVSGGSMQALLTTFGCFDESVVRLYTLQVLQGLEFLHSRNIVHGDIKPANLLITDKGQIKLSDFGTSHIIGGARDIASIAGTPRWMSPDMVQTGEASRASDIWALGCVVMEMSTGVQPWSDVQFDNAFSLVYHIGNSTTGPNTSCLNDISPSLRSFIVQCLQMDPKQRPVASELFKHPFLLDQQTPPSEPQLQRVRSSAGDHRAFIERLAARAPTADDVAVAVRQSSASGLTTAFDELRPARRPPRTESPP
jgi:serine/threonine protein kinase